MLHEGLVSLFREKPVLAPDLLARALCAELPEYTEARIDSADLTSILPTERRADLVIQLRHGDCVFGIIVEVQLKKDQDKGFVWPVYLTTLRDRIRCPVYLLVVAPDDKVADWACQPILLGGDSRVIPWVLRLADIPKISDAEQAKRDPELTVLSALAHGRDDDVCKSAEIALAAHWAAKTLDKGRAALYVDLVLNALSEAALRALQEMEPMKHQLQSEFARLYHGQGMEQGLAEGKAEGLAEGRADGLAKGKAEGLAEGKAEGLAEGRADGLAEGKAEGRAEMALKLLSRRFGTLSEATQTRIQQASLSELDALAERLLDPGNLDEVLGELAYPLIVCPPTVAPATQLQ